MAENRLHAVVVSVAVLLCVLQTSVLASQKSYIIYMGSQSHGLSPTAEDSEIATQSHYDLLGTVLGSDDKAKEAIICSYNKYINGFAASLSEEEAERIKSYPGVVSVFENKEVKLQTTHSWEFMGLDPAKQSLWTKSNYGKDIIIATLDTGVWPESESFKDDGFGPVPSTWKGACVDGSPTNKVRCNNKLIGARYFYKGYERVTGVRLSSYYHSARDTDGHGTHALSTAGGNFVVEANILGNDYGMAKGGSPKARVAAYKVCWPPVNGFSCAAGDIMNAFDAAIADGVDVLSVSLAGEPVDYIKDSKAIGAFHAMQHGIPVVAAAGNSGPRASTVSNTAPWILTVGSSTMDREFTNWVSFGGKYYKGKNLGGKLLPEGRLYPVINSTSAKLVSATVESATLCEQNSLDPSKVKGKIVVCLNGIKPTIERGLVVLKAGGAGYILANDFKDPPSVTTLIFFLHHTYLTKMAKHFSDSSRRPRIHMLSSTKQKHLLDPILTVPLSLLAPHREDPTLLTQRLSSLIL